MKTLTPQILAMYLGVPCNVKNADNESFDDVPLLAVNLNDCAFFNHDELEDEPIDVRDVKPLLRKLSSMTKLEEQEFTEIDYRENNDNAHMYAWVKCVAQHSLQIKWLLSKHFDLFNLIENNLAIDKDGIEVDPPRYDPGEHDFPRTVE